MAIRPGLVFPFWPAAGNNTKSRCINALKHQNRIPLIFPILFWEAWKLFWHLTNYEHETMHFNEIKEKWLPKEAIFLSGCYPTFLVSRTILISGLYPVAHEAINTNHLQFSEVQFSTVQFSSVQRSSVVCAAVQGCVTMPWYSSGHD